MPKGNTIYIHYVCEHEAADLTGLSPLHFITVDMQSFPWGRANAITLHTPYLLPSADITICEIQGELAVFDTHAPSSPISSNYTNVMLALPTQTSSKLSSKNWGRTRQSSPNSHFHSTVLKKSGIYSPNNFIAWFVRLIIKSVLWS